MRAPTETLRPASRYRRADRQGPTRTYRGAAPQGQDRADAEHRPFDMLATAALRGRNPQTGLECFAVVTATLCPILPPCGLAKLQERNPSLAMRGARIRHHDTVADQGRK
jgi:hypothetical protein